MSNNEFHLNYSGGKKFLGPGQRTLVSALVGASIEKGIEEQFKKIDLIHQLPDHQKPDIISDLSIIRSKETPLYKFIITNYPEFAVSTLPVYLCNRANGLIDERELLDIIYEFADAGINMITIHPSPNINLVRSAQNRMTPWTSRGGGIIINDLVKRKFQRENAYLKIIDDIIKIALINSIVISIGASFRSANIFDSYDVTQIEEFKVQKEIADYISAKGVNVIIEGPGHSSPRKIKVISESYLKMGYPIMPLGPIPTDIALGQDHISSSIGAVLLGMNNCADIITAVTREEHTGGIPSTASTIEAILASKIAAHIIDMHKLEDYSEDFKIAEYRAEHHTCVYGKTHSGCSRCLEACPLNVEIN